MAIFSVVGTAEAGGHYSQAGCGLGSMIITSPGFTQVFAATTNGTAGNQTFGITSGTSNCDAGATHASVPAFVEANRVALANDAARGNGETVASLSEVLGCQDATELGATLQKNYKSIFPTETVAAEQVSNTIVSLVKADDRLAKSCSNAI
jgi:hypothetical protein